MHSAAHPDGKDDGKLGFCSINNRRNWGFALPRLSENYGLKFSPLRGTRYAASPLLGENSSNCRFARFLHLPGRAIGRVCHVLVLAR
jgi:hypothetical protein